MKKTAYLISWAPFNPNGTTQTVETTKREALKVVSELIRDGYSDIRIKTVAQ